MASEGSPPLPDVLLARADWLTPRDIAATPASPDGLFIEAASTGKVVIDAPGIVGRGSTFRDCRVNSWSIIGRYCCVGEAVEIGTETYDFGPFTAADLSLAMDEPPRTASAPPVTVIGCDVWIGMRAAVRRGLSIGHGAIVMPHAIVTQDVPAYAVVAGHPAAVQRYRFAESVIARLAARPWWLLPEEQARQLVGLDVESALSAIESTPE